MAVLGLMHKKTVVLLGMQLPSAETIKVWLHSSLRLANILLYANIITMIMFYNSKCGSTMRMSRVKWYIVWSIHSGWVLIVYVLTQIVTYCNIGIFA